jgi:excisionase family DNA binding protein
MEQDSPKYKTIKQASDITGLHPNTIRNYIHTGKIKAVRAGSRVIRIEVSEIDKLFTEYKRGEFGIWSQII